MHKTTILFWTLFFSVFSIGCAIPSSPLYKFAQDEKTALLKPLSKYGTPFLCRDGIFYDFEGEPGTNYVKIPAGKRITIGQYVYRSISTGTKTITQGCKTSLRFIPQVGKKYITDTNVTKKGCLIEVVEENPDSNTGLSIEMSVGAGDCFLY